MQRLPSLEGEPIATTASLAHWQSHSAINARLPALINEPLSSEYVIAPIDEIEEEG
jgi:hypothetical protein